MTYDELLMAADKEGLITKEKDLLAHDGRIKDNRVAIRKTISTQCEKACVLAEELGHHHTTYGDIMDQSTVSARKQERHARLWAYDKLIGLNGLIVAYMSGYREKHDLAEYLGVTESFLDAALAVYRERYGVAQVHHGRYRITFEPTLTISTEEGDDE